MTQPMQHPAGYLSADGHWWQPVPTARDDAELTRIQREASNLAAEHRRIMDTLISERTGKAVPGGPTSIICAACGRPIGTRGSDGAIQFRRNMGARIEDGWASVLCSHRNVDPQANGDKTCRQANKVRIAA